MARKAKLAKSASGKKRGRKPFPRDAAGNPIRPDGTTDRKRPRTRADAPGVSRARARTKVTEEPAAPAAGDNQASLSYGRQKELHDQHLESAIKVDRRVKDAGAAQRALAKQVKADLGPFAWQFLQAEVRAAKDAEEWVAFSDRINRHIELARIVGRKLPGLEASTAAAGPAKPKPVKGPPANAKTINAAYREGEAAALKNQARELPEKYESGSVFGDSWFAGFSAGVAKRPTEALPADEAPRPPHHVDSAAEHQDHEQRANGSTLEEGQQGDGDGEDVRQVADTDDFDGGFENAA